MPPRLPLPEVLRAAAAQVSLGVWPEGSAEEPVAVAVSGGADSIYLLCALWAEPSLRPRLRVLHFDHQVRGAASAADAAFVGAFCAALGVPFYQGTRVGQGAASEGVLRTARNAFFAEQRRSLGFRIVATAHHLDDVVETMLLRLARGAGLTGLSAPRIRQPFNDGHVRWRPLIAAGLTKVSILTTLTAAGIPWCEDATNVQPVAVRNRIRAWLTQGGEAALGSDYAQGFAGSAQILEQSAQALLGWADELGCGLDATGKMDARGLQGRPPALAHAALHRFLQGHGLGAAGPASLASLVTALVAGRDTQVSVLAAGVRLKAGVISVVARTESFGPEVRSLRQGQLDPECGLRWERVDVDEALWVSLSRGDLSPQCEVILAPTTPVPLYWRGRVVGDRYRPLGAPGEASLGDLLTNRKVPLELRDTLPVVMAGNIILWVPGLPPADNARLAGPCKGALRLTWLMPCLNWVSPL